MTIAIFCGVAVFGLVFFFVRPSSPIDLIKRADLFELTNLLVNLVVLVVSIVSLFIAVAAYQATESSGVEQQKILEASRNALQASVDLSQNQIALMSDSLGVISEHLNIVKGQVSEEQERLARKPKVGKIPESDFKNEVILLIPPTMQNFDLDFQVKNVGDAPIRRPTAIVKTNPTTVSVARGI